MTGLDETIKRERETENERERGRGAERERVSEGRRRNQWSECEGMDNPPANIGFVQ